MNPDLEHAAHRARMRELFERECCASPAPWSGWAALLRMARVTAVAAARAVGVMRATPRAVRVPTPPECCPVPA